VINGHRFDEAWPGRGGKQEQRQAVGSAGNGHSQPITGSAQAVEIAREARDEWRVGDHI
jgi:hypothetical protein